MANTPRPVTPAEIKDEFNRRFDKTWAEFNAWLDAVTEDGITEADSTPIEMEEAEQ